VTEQHQPPPLNLDAIEALGAAWLTEKQLAALLAELRALRATVAALTAERDAARAVLAPLLDRPGYICRFCGVEGWSPGNTHHRPDCSVLRRDALLGRAREGAG
jgi:hypothetical protein